MPIVVITGATGGMGSEATRAKAREGCRVIMACNDLKKAEELRAKILEEQPDADLVPMYLELTSLASIQQFVGQLKGMQIDALFCNAGVKAHRFTTTEEGVELDYATNYMGNRRLADLMVPIMKPGGCVVFMVSVSIKVGHVDLNWKECDKRHFGQVSTYANSKLALTYYAIALARKHPELHINVADPGIVNTDMITMGRWYDPLADIFFRPFIKTPKQGVYAGLQAMNTQVTMKYFVGKKIKDMPKKLLESPLVDQLWEQGV